MKRSGGWFCRLWFETCSLFVVYSVYGTKSQSSWQSGGSWTVRAGSMGIDDKVHTSIDNQVLHRTNLPDVPKGVISFFTKRTKKRRLCWLILSKCWRTLLKIVYWIEIFTTCDSNPGGSERCRFSAREVFVENTTFSGLQKDAEISGLAFVNVVLKVCSALQLPVYFDHTVLSVSASVSVMLQRVQL